MADQFQRVGLIATVEGIQQYLANVDKVAKGQDRIQKEMDETAARSGKAATKVVRDWDKVGRSMVIVGGVITGALAFGVKSAIDFESAFADVRKTVDEGEPGFIRLEQGINDMSRRLPLAREEIARVTAAAGQLGIEGVDNLLAFTEVAIGLGISTDLSAEQAAFALAQLFNVTGDTGDRIEILGSVIVALGNNTATTESRILDFSQRIAASAANAGLSTEEIFALSATVLSLGVSAERGGTQVSRAFVQITTAVEEGGEELQIFADLAGLSAREFATLWREDATAAFELFIEGLSKEGSKAVLVLDALGFEGTRAVEVFQALARAEGDLSRNIQLANAAALENAALAEEVARRNDTAAARIKIAWNEIKIAFGEAGEEILPFLEAGLDLLKLFVSVWESLPEPLRAATIGFVGVAGVLILFGGSLLFINTQLGIFSRSTIQAALAASRFGISVQLAIPAVGLLLAAVTAITLGFLAMGRAADEAGNRAQQAADLSALIRDLEKVGSTFKLVIGLGIGWIEVIDDQEEARRRLAAGTARTIELEIAEAQAIVRLVDSGLDLIDAQNLVVAKTEAAGLATNAYAQALRNAARDTELTEEEIDILVGAFLQEEEAAFAARNSTDGFSQAAIDAAEAARQAADDIAKMSSRAFAAKIIFDKLTGANIDEGIFALGQIGAQLLANELERLNAENFDLLVGLIKLEDQAEKDIDALLDLAFAAAGVTREVGGAGGAVEKISLAFDDAVAAIRGLRAEMALGILIDELRAEGGNEEALVLALLLSAEERTGREIQAGILQIAELFPTLGSAIGPDAGGEDQALGLALLIQLLGGRAGGSSLPSFATGGLVTGGRRDAPMLAQLHVGEFVIPADKVQALLGPLQREGSSRGDVNFTANYFELESPVRVRDDLEALRLQGVF